MHRKTPRFDPVFLETKRRQLLELRGQLQKTANTGEAEEAEINDQSASQAREYEDDAQKLAMLEVDGAAVRRNMQRLTQVERALQKIEDGTYGLSDTSGEPIPRERLEAMPEAIHTVSELSEAEPADDR